VEIGAGGKEQGPVVGGGCARCASWIQVDPTTGRMLLVIPLTSSRVLVANVEVAGILVFMVIIGAVIFYRQRQRR